MSWLSSPYWFLFVAIWYAGNGILHDIFVLINHKRKYDRELLRLLMDGHVLILCGAIVFVGFLMLQNKIPYAGLLGLVIGISMLAYCAMIFPFLKSIGTILVSLLLIIVSIRAM